MSAKREIMSPQPGKALKHRAEWRQRRFPRYRVEFPVSLTLFSGTERQQMDAHSRDLSEAGIGVLIASELPIGEVAIFNFTLPGSKEAWDVRAVLRHRRGYHYGFEFLSLTEEQSQDLTKYLPSQHRADGDSGASFRDQEAPAANK